MCGIIGGPDPGVFAHMTTKLVHRGQMMFKPGKAAKFTRFHTAGISISRMVSSPTMCAAGDMVSVFNGEIGNHAALREQFWLRVTRSPKDIQTPN